MRRLLPLLALAACSGPDGASPGPPVLRLEALPIPEGATVVVDGSLSDAPWARARELVVPLRGGAAGEVRLKAVHDGRRLYLLAVWKDEAASLDRYFRYEGNLVWRKSEREDGFSVCWTPGAAAAGFRAQGCAMTCHGGRHLYPGAGGGCFDFWYWGAQQTNHHPQGRDMQLPRGEDQRLRGDRQPGDSDNVPNVSGRYEGPCLFPTIRRKGDTRVLFHGHPVKEVTPDWIRKHWKDELHVGDEVPLELLRGRRGSRGDVRAAARHHADAGKWVLEMARDFETGNADDLPLGDPFLPALFALAVYDGGGGADHAVSGPIELHFLPAP